MKTIKTKLFLLFVSFMAAFVFCSLLMNSLFLERYYIYTSQDLFLSSRDRIAAVYPGQGEGTAEIIKAIDRVDGISCSIYDPDLKLRMASYPQKPEPGQNPRNDHRLPRELEMLMSEHQPDLDNSYVYGIVESPDYFVREIAFITRLKDGSLLVMKKPLKGISESSAIASRFAAAVSVLIMLPGGLFIYLFSRRLTRPIRNMSQVAEEIANLNFDRQVTISSDDEIGDLGRSINLISHKLNRSIQSLRADVERRKHLVHNISHELKSPIGIIKGYAEGLQYGVADDPQKNDRYCSVIVAECDRMDQMVKELLSFSRLESGMFSIQPVLLDLEVFIRNIAFKFAPLMQEKGISLQARCEPGLTIVADQELLERAVSNYLRNALQHSDGMRPVELRAQELTGSVRISVFNSGSAIPEAELQNIWDVFYTVDKARTRNAGGHGLGLSIVRTIAELHGAEWGVINQEDGVLFYIDLVS